MSENKCQYMVTGMTCAACQAHVEKAVSRVPGVDKVTVSLLTNSMSVEGKASASDVVEAVEKAGYGAKPMDASSAGMSRLEAEKEALEDHETPKLKRRLLISILFLIVLMYFTMGHNMLDLPVPFFLNHNHLGLALTEMILAFIVMAVNHAFFDSGFRSLFHRSPNMDTLVALGSSVSFGWSLYVFYKMTWLITQGSSSMDIMPLYHDQLYFESAAMIPALITVGKLLESISKGRTTDALKGLMKIAPKTALVEREGKESLIPVEEVRAGDIFIVKPGESVPVDGEILEGETAVDESALTGESVPVDKKPGDRVSAATMNTNGYIRARALRVGEDTTFAQIIRMVSDAAATKAPIARIADKVSAVFVPAVILISILVFLLWILLGAPVSRALEYAICVLVISCPCALGLATPVAIMVGNGMGAKNGILFKTSEALENAGKIDIAVMDKTGTITEGKPKVTDMVPAEGVSEKELLEKAYALEVKSEHPLALAVVDYGNRKSVKALPLTDFKILSGHGLEGTLGGKKLHGGSASYISTLTSIKELKDRAQALAEEGKTPLFFEEEGKLLGLMAVADVIKEDSPRAIQKLKDMGIQVVMLTGDNEKTAAAMARKAGVDHVIAGVLPDGKETVIRKLQAYGKVAMVGDGINDAPALVKADTGIAIGAGTDVAIDSADIVLMNSRLSDVSAAVRLSRETMKNIHENLFWAFAYNVLLIPMAAGLYPGIRMNPMWGAAAMSLSSFTVCMNALRLNLFNVRSPSRDKKKKMTVLPDWDTISGKPSSEEKPKAAGGKAVVLVEGMMCENCENHVKKALESLPFITGARADHKTGRVSITYSSQPDEAAMKQVLAKADYEYKGILFPKEETNMKETVKIEGMMCNHCEMTVKKALEALDGVEKADVSHTKGTAVLTLDKAVADGDIKKAIEDKDYTFKGIEK
ncbi:MAG TPA: heavy metal translocating P-type ATPase [Veillonellaceae bacterium]|nr:heavy metal translocating P-type ATPase [Veillonellaceae bacterium]